MKMEIDQRVIFLFQLVQQLTRDRLRLALLVDQRPNLAITVGLVEPKLCKLLAQP
ncbi:hypothetical protein D9M68_994020 [compost metagenome]